MLILIASMGVRLKGFHSEDIRNLVPSEITLPMSVEELENTENNRIQNRTIKSVRLGSIGISYQTGITANGTRIAPDELRLLVAPGMVFAYDTILFVTVLRYVHLMQREEIQAKILRDHYFKISTGSISEFSLMGLAYLERCHFAKAKKLAELYERGCFILHLDGTNEGGIYTHFVVREGIRGNVLYAEKIVSESEKAIIPILKKVKQHFGVPDAMISDMSAPIGKAVQAMFPNIPHRLCHFHFLKAIGTSLLSEKHKPLMISVKRMKNILNAQRKGLVAKLNSSRNKKYHEDCTWLISIIDQINDYQNDLSGEGFPFDLPALAFHNSCEQVSCVIETILNEVLESEKELCIILCFIKNRIQEFLDCSQINQLKNLNDIFMKLRDILHPKTEKEQTPLSWGMINSDTQLVDIEGKLEKLYERSVKKAKNKQSKYLLTAWGIVQNRLKKYKGKLNPVIEFNDENFILPRTNNLCETGFRDCKRKGRRITGLRHLSNYMDNLPPQYFYTFNLDDLDYIKTVFGNGEICDSFHFTDKNSVKADVEKMKIQRLSPKSIDYKLIRGKDYFKRFTEHFTSQEKGGNSLRSKEVA